MPSRTILFADDSATMRTIMEKAFFAEDFEVVTVPSGEAAMTRAKEIRPNVILVDSGMIGVSGYDVCKAVRDDPSIAHTPVVIMSGVSNPYDENKAREVGATDHVKKPFDTAKLIEKMVELAGGAKDVDTVTAPAAAPPIPKPPMKPAAAGATLHAFPSPAAATKPPVPPVFPKPVPKPEPTHKETMEFARPRTEPIRDPDVKPIELDEPGADEGQIQVGTLAELAQMNERGEKISHDIHEDAIELTEPVSPPPVSPPEPVQQAPVAASTMEESISAAARTVAQKVEGITNDQAEAIRKLTAEVIEQVVWEVVPDLAETIIRERIQELLAE